MRKKDAERERETHKDLHKRLSRARRASEKIKAEKKENAVSQW